MKKEDVLRLAFQTLEQREDTYGTPYENFKRVADMLTAYLGVDVQPHDVCVIEIIQKIVRLQTSNGLHSDSWIDIAGYAGIGAEVAHEEEKESISIKEFLRKSFRMEDPPSKDTSKSQSKT
jgi:hypothetical protein